MPNKMLLRLTVYLPDDEKAESLEAYLESMSWHGVSSISNIVSAFAMTSQYPANGAALHVAKIVWGFMGCYGRVEVQTDHITVGLTNEFVALTEPDYDNLMLVEAPPDMFEEYKKEDEFKIYSDPLWGLDERLDQIG